MKLIPTLSPNLLKLIDGYWRAANYLSVGQIYLANNPLLKRPLTLSDVKHMLLGHWGTTPGQNFIYAHLNRVIKKYDLNMIYVSGPGHGGPAVVGNTYLEGTYSEIYPNISQDEAGLQKLFWQFSFPGGIPSHVSPDCPGSIHEGGELGYSLSHSFGAVFDNPELVNELDRFHLVMDAIDRLPQTGSQGIYLKQKLADKLVEHRRYINRNGRDLPEVLNWVWDAKAEEILQ
jgi:xylulose-5-phosphate/fructose-6-phosphate phosphoketolase